MYKNLVPRVAAIHDLSGFGRSSLTVIMPVLSTMGIQVCPLPTAVLSTHSAFPDFHFRDLTDDMNPIIDHWKRLQLRFDAIYSGYMGSAKQIDIVRGFIRDFQHSDQLIVVDPVLGDDGKLYRSFTHEMVDKMKELVCDANVITPNMTEAALLLDEPYTVNLSETRLKDWAKRLSAFGPQTVIITSAPVTDKRGKTSVVAYNSTDDRYWKVVCDYLPASYPGTGDAFASVITGSLIQGDSLPIAIDRAVQFISIAVRATFGYNYKQSEGILLEKVLSSLNAPVQLSSYQLLD
ncbi:MAG: pyridoxamine kinase [Prolixibacteraceae bacterium]|jgi:pyridoxine kinase